MANKHCRKFNNHEDYISALIDGELIKHNISYCKMEKDAHYDKWLDNRYMIECHYYITDTTKRYNIYQNNYGAYQNFKEIVIDGNKIENYDFQYGYTYAFNTPGEHTIKYNFSDINKIPQYAFSDCDTLTHVEYNDIYNIGYIQLNCFKNDVNLTECNLPKDISCVSSGAFQNTGITSLIIPASVKKVESDMNNGQPFKYCNFLDSITVDENNPVYDSRDNCNAIIETHTNTLIAGCKNTVIPSDVSAIGFCAFEGIPIINVSIPDTVTTIYRYAFTNSSIVSLNIPATTTKIGYNRYSNYSITNTFNNNQNLASITVDENNPLYDSRDNCNAIIETSTNMLMVGCKNTIIPNTVTSIRPNAFSGCGIQTLTIPASVTSLHSEGGTGQLENTRLKYLTILATTPPAKDNGPQGFVGIYPIFVPEESVNIYKNAQYWSYFESRIYPIPSDYNAFMEEYEKMLDEEKYIVIKFNITDISKPTQLYYYNYDMFQINIDDFTTMDRPSTFQFTTTGIHTVKYIYKLNGDSITINSGIFTGLTSVKSISFGKRYTSFGQNAFAIDNVDYVILYQQNPGGLQSASAFPENCPIYVPDESVQAYKSSWTSLASRIYPLSDLQQ